MTNADPRIQTYVAEFQKACKGEDVKESLAVLTQIIYMSHAENVKSQEKIDPSWFEPFDPTPLYPDIDVVRIDLPDGDDYDQIDQDGNITM